LSGCILSFRFRTNSGVDYDFHDASIKSFEFL
jgi:hypothetical protein